MGAETTDPGRILVRVVAEMDRMAEAPSPNSVDSLAAEPSRVREEEEPKPDETQHEKPVEVNKEPDPDPSQREPAPENPPEILAKESESDTADFVIPDMEEKEPEAVDVPPEERTETEPVEKDNLQKSRKQSVASAPSEASSERRARSTAGADLKEFQAMLLAAINKATFFPKSAWRHKKHGETVVRFAVVRQGSIADLSVVKSSGSSILDEAALDIIRKASSEFPPIPKSVLNGRLSYVVPILFKDKRSRTGR